MDFLVFVAAVSSGTAFGFTVFVFLSERFVPELKDMPLLD